MTQLVSQQNVHPATPQPPTPPQNTWYQTAISGVSRTLAYVCKQVFSAAQAATKSATAIHAAVADNGASQTITTGITQPPCAQNVTATPSGTTANVTAVQMIINGTDLAGNVIQETLPAFTAGQATAVVGVKAFASITSYVQPACGTSVLISLGTGSKLGLQDLLTENSVLHASLNGVKEATAPTVNYDPVNLSGNTVLLNSALNGTKVSIYYLPL